MSNEFLQTVGNHNTIFFRPIGSASLQKEVEECIMRRKQQIKALPQVKIHGKDAKETALMFLGPYTDIIIGSTVVTFPSSTVDIGKILCLLVNY